MLVFELLGNAGAGKTKIGNSIMRYYGDRGMWVSKLSFATKLKRLIKDYMYMTKHGFMSDFRYPSDYSANIHNLYKEACKDMHQLLLWDENEKCITSTVEKIISTCKYHIDYDELIRHIFQNIGTDLIRKHLGDDYWVNGVISNVLSSAVSGVDVTIIDDYRFPNEDLKSLENHNNIKVIRIFVDASDDIRRERLGLSVEQFNDMSSHASEIQVKDLPYDIKYDNSYNDDGKFTKNIEKFINSINEGVNHE
jgi:hypothetical protein